MISVHQQRGMGRPAPPKSHAGRNDQVISDLTDKFVPVLETGVAFGYLNGICKAVCLNKPVTCDRLLGFRKRVAVMRGTVVVDGDAFGKIEAIVECG
jgi:hypothetical protein